MRVIFLIILWFYTLNKNSNDIIFNANKTNYKKTEKVALTIKNCNSKPVFYYIGLKTMSDTGWVYVINDIDNLRRNEVFGLNEIKPNEKKIDFLNIKYILKRYFYSNKQKFLLTIRYSNKRQLFNNSFLKKDIEIQVNQ